MWTFPVTKDFDKFYALGERTDVAGGAAGDDLWPHANSTMSIPDQTSGVQLSLVSSSANDVLTTGTGLWTVRVHYLDGNWNPATEDIDLNGLGAVTSVATDVKFVQRVHAIAAGTLGRSAGAITISEQGGAGVYSEIPANGDMSLACMRMVPAGKTFRLMEWNASSGGNKTIIVKLRANTLGDSSSAEVYGTDNPLFLDKDTCTLLDSTYVKVFAIPYFIPEKSVIKITAWGPAGGQAPDLSASFEGILV